MAPLERSSETKPATSLLDAAFLNLGPRSLASAVKSAELFRFRDAPAAPAPTFLLPVEETEREEVERPTPAPPPPNSSSARVLSAFSTCCCFCWSTDVCAGVIKMRRPRTRLT